MPKQPISQADLNRLDQFLHSNASGHAAMGLSYAHGFLAALASGPERMEPEAWLRLMFGKHVPDSGSEAKEMINLTLQIFDEIDHRLKTNVGFRPIFNNISKEDVQSYADAQPWCLGFTDGIKLFSESWTNEANEILQKPLALIFNLADVKGQPGAGYARLCDIIPDATEFIYTYWLNLSRQ